MAYYPNPSREGNIFNPTAFPSQRNPLSNLGQLALLYPNAQGAITFSETVDNVINVLKLGAIGIEYNGQSVTWENLQIKIQAIGALSSATDSNTINVNNTVRIQNGETSTNPQTTMVLTSANDVNNLILNGGGCVAGSTLTINQYDTMAWCYDKTGDLINRTTPAFYDAFTKGETLPFVPFSLPYNTNPAFLDTDEWSAFVFSGAQTPLQYANNYTPNMTLPVLGAQNRKGQNYHTPELFKINISSDILNPIYSGLPFDVILNFNGDSQDLFNYAVGQTDPKTDSQTVDITGRFTYSYGTDPIFLLVGGFKTSTTPTFCMLSFGVLNNDGGDYTNFTYKGASDVTKYDYINWIGIQDSNLSGTFRASSSGNTVVFNTPLDYTPMVYAQYKDTNDTGYLQVQVSNVSNTGFNVTLSTTNPSLAYQSVQWVALKPTFPPTF